MRVKTDIDYLIIWKNLQGIANHEEVASFNNWVQNSKQNRRYYDRLKRNYELDKLEVSQKDIEQSWHAVQSRVKRTKSFTFRRISQYAAAILIPLTIAIGVIYLPDNELQTIEMAHQIQPGSSKAVLQLADGQVIDLDANRHQVIADSKGAVLGTDSINVLTYKMNDHDSEQTFNTIKIPRGGEYQLVLSDGTRVWLNSESSLTYPVSFTGDSRQVFLTGEAYFDVTTNKAIPFIVKTATQGIKVYGTQFNVMAYDDDDIIETTLVEGSVAVVVDGAETMIKPGQQSRMNASTGTLLVDEVNVDVYTAWKDGIFRFEEMTLQQMADKLGRWYDVDFFFFNEDVKGKKFTGAVRRETNFEFFIKLIEETTKVKIDVNDKTVLVKALY